MDAVGAYVLGADLRDLANYVHQGHAMVAGGELGVTSHEYTANARAETPESCLCQDPE